MSVISNNTLAGSSGQGGGGYEIERSLRLNAHDSAFLSRTPSSSGNLTTWTMSVWVKNTLDYGPSGNYPALFGADNYNGYRTFFRYTTTGTWEFYSEDGRHETIEMFRDPSAWYHLVIVWDTSNSTAADRLILYVNGVRQTWDGNPTLNGVSGFNANVVNLIGKEGQYTRYINAYLADYHFIDGQALAASDFGEYDSNSVWQPKEYAGTYGTNGFHLDFSDTSSDAALGTDTSGNGNTWTVNNLAATNLGATTNSSVSASNTYVVSDVMATVTGTYDFENAFDGNSGTIGYIGQVIFHNEGTYSKPIVANSSGGVEVMGSGAGITAAINGGSQVNCANGGFTKISGTFNGTLDSINVYNNTSGASYFTAVRVNGVEIAVRRQSPASEIDLYRDSPVNGNSANDTGAGGEITGNYCTWNPLVNNSVGAAQYTYSDGNLVVNNVTNAYGYVTGTIYASSGKWYAEFVPGASLDATYDYIGITALNSNRNYPGQVTNGFWYAGSGNKVNSGFAGSSYGATYATGDVIGVALDLDNYTVTFYKNGVSQGVAFTGLDSSTSWTFSTGDYANSITVVNYTANFGQRAFAYPVSGYKCLNTANLSDPLIADGSTAFDSKLYSGTGSSQSITGLGFSPDLVWTKNRGASASHALYDSVRGAGELLRSNETTAEVNVSSRFTSFDSNGFSIGGPSSENNGSSNSYVSWAWDAGSSNTTVAAGGLNSSLFNTSQTWSTYGTASGTQYGSYVWADVFDNVTLTSQNVGNCVYGPTYKWTFTSPISVTSSVSLRVWGIGDVILNDGESDQVTLTSAGNTYNTITDVSLSSASLKNIKLATGTAVYLFAVYVDGKQLVDSGVPPNVPSIASTYRANPSAGFSIVSYTATSSTGSIGHGLNAAPAFVVCKRRDSTGSWWAGHVGAGWTKGAYLQVTDAFSALSGFWNNTAPDSNVVTLGSYPTEGSTSATYVAYCFAPVEGYSAFGSYEGNGDADGPFVFTGFKPAFLLTKWIDGNDQWNIYDVKRSTFNVTDDILRPNYDYGENSGSAVDAIDILSNGFKIRSSNQNINAASTYLYYAVAEHPFKNSRAR